MIGCDNYRYCFTCQTDGCFIRPGLCANANCVFSLASALRFAAHRIQRVWFERYEACPIGLRCLLCLGRSWLEPAAIAYVVAALAQLVVLRPCGIIGLGRLPRRSRCRRTSHGGAEAETRAANARGAPVKLYDELSVSMLLARSLGKQCSICSRFVITLHDRSLGALLARSLSASVNREFDIACGYGRSTFVIAR